MRIKVFGIQMSTQQALVREQLELARQQTAAANPNGGTPIAQVIEATPAAQAQQSTVRATANMNDTFDVVNMVVNGVGIIVGVIGAWIGYKAMRVEAVYRQQIAAGNTSTSPQIVESTARPVEDVEQPVSMTEKPHNHDEKAD